jgi:uncharacterized protein YoxC
MTGGQVAGLIVAVFWAVLVCFLAFVLVRLARLLSEATRMVAEVGERAAPLLEDMADTVAQANEQLDRVDLITKSVGGVTQNAAAVSSIVGGPLVKVAAFSYGVRKAIGGRGQDGKR